MTSIIQVWFGRVLYWRFFWLIWFSRIEKYVFFRSSTNALNPSLTPPLLLSPHRIKRFLKFIKLGVEYFFKVSQTSIFSKYIIIFSKYIINWIFFFHKATVFWIMWLYITVLIQLRSGFSRFQRFLYQIPYIYLQLL